MKNRLVFLLMLCITVTGLQAQVNRSVMPSPGPSPQINIGIPSIFQLSNGMKVLVVENHKYPTVNVRLTLANKPYAQEQEAGVQELYSAMMGNGTQEMSKEEFNSRIDFLGASVSYGAESARASSLTQFFPEIFGLMAKGLLHPKFTTEVFNNQKKRLLQSIEANQNNAKAIAANLQRQLTYGKNHPYGEFATVESVVNLTLSDVRNYYNNFITPKNAYLVVVGDIEPDAVKKLAEKYFGTWMETTPPTTTLPPVLNAQYTQIDFINVPNAVQSIIAITNSVHLKKTSPDYFAAMIANQILGGGADGRLFQNLREDKAYTYGAYSSLTSDQYVSEFKASASVRNAVTDSAVVAFLDEINRIRNEKVSLQELKLAKAKFVGSFVRSLEKPATIARQALTIERDSLPDDFYINYIQHVQAVTADEVLKAAQKYFKVNHARIIIVGDGPAVATSLENLNYKGEAIPIEYYNIKGDELNRPAYVKVDTQQVNTVHSVYADYIKAIGGENAVKAVKSIYAKYDGVVGTRTINMVTEQTKDGKSLTKVSFGGVTLREVVYNGKEGFVKAGEQKRAFNETELAQAQQQQKLGLFPELSVPQDALVTGIQKVGDKNAYVVRHSDKELDYYSVETGLKLQSVTKTSMGPKVTKYSHYKTVNGVKFPFTISESVGQHSITYKAQEIVINQKVADADFQ